MELVDVGDSKSPGSDTVPVRVRPGAPTENCRNGSYISRISIKLIVKPFFMCYEVEPTVTEWNEMA